MESRDAETCAKALLDLETFLNAYLEPGPRDADHTIGQVLALLDRREVMDAARRVIAGFGLHVVK